MISHQMYSFSIIPSVLQPTPCPPPPPPLPYTASQSPEEAIAFARVADLPGQPPTRIHSGPARGSPRHRIALSADDARTEAMLLLSVVTEGEPEMEEEKERRMHPSAADDVDSKRHGGEEDRGWWENEPESDRSWKNQSEEYGGDFRGGAEVARRRQREGAPWRDATGRRMLGGEEQDMPARSKGERPASGDNEGQREMRRRCLQRVEAAAGRGFEGLRTRHVDDVEAMFNRVDFSLGSSSDGAGVDERKSNDARSFRSCRSGVAGLPIRTRVSRSGKACTEGVEGVVDAPSKGVTDNDKAGAGRTVVDDGLVELMYHYGRSVRLVCDFKAVRISMPTPCIVAPDRGRNL